VGGLCVNGPKVRQSEGSIVRKSDSLTALTRVIEPSDYRAATSWVYCTGADGSDSSGTSV